MIYTITLNPAVDHFVRLSDHLLADEVNRASHEVYKAGGKGLNVSKVLSLYGIQSTAVCLLGGFTGEFIANAVKDNALIKLMPVRVNGTNRINLKASYGNKALVINGSGPKADRETILSLYSIMQNIRAEDYVIVSGSMMQGLDHAFLIELCRIIHEHKGQLIMDMEIKNIDLLRQCRPNLIKPNLYELRILLDDETIVKENIIEKVQPLLSSGISEILVSLGAQGAVLAAADDALYMDQPHQVMINKSGAGDALLASYIAERSMGCTREQALVYAGAAGNAAASKIEDITYDDIETFCRYITVSRLPC